MRGAMGALRRSTINVGDAVRINVTPMIDVVMVLIIFFLLVGRLAGERLGPVDLPSAPGGLAADGASNEVIVTVRDAGDGLDIRVNGRPTALAGAAALVNASGGEGSYAVRLRAERSLGYGRVRPVVQACREAGAAEVRLAALESEAGP